MRSKPTGLNMDMSLRPNFAPKYRGRGMCLDVQAFVLRIKGGAFGPIPTRHLFKQSLSSTSRSTMMFTRSLIASVALFTAMVASAPTPDGAHGGTNNCSSGSNYCCNSFDSSDKGLLNLGKVLGLNCSPISVIGVGSTSCTTQTACCSGNSFDGLVPIACNNINIL